MKIRQNLANYVTLINAFCGILAVIAIQENALLKAVALLALALLADFLDGLVARLLKLQSKLGAELDSLADALSFGLAPSLILYHYWCKISPDTSFLALLFCLSAIWRLAKFNIDSQQQSGIFIGLPTPAAALAVMALPLMFWQEPVLSEYLSLPLLLLFTLLLSYLMHAPITLLSLKFKHFGWSENQARYVFLVCAIFFIFLLQALAPLLILVLYLILSVFQKKQNNNPS